METQYSIGSGIIEEYEAQVMSGISKLYQQEDLAIVKGVLIPHFRSQLTALFEEFREAKTVESNEILDASQISVLCDMFDQMINEQRDLLDVDGLFKPVMKRIQTLRSKIATALEAQGLGKYGMALREQGIATRESLIGQNPGTFHRAKFGDIGKGINLARAVLGKNIKYVKKSHLIKIAEILQLEKTDKEKTKKDHLDALSLHGITDLKSLKDCGPAEFNILEFGNHGGARSFLRAVLGKSLRKLNMEMEGRTDNNIRSIVLAAMAKELALPKFSEERIADFKGKLRGHGIPDRDTLAAFNTTAFERLEFGEYGKGKGFAAAVLGKTFKYLRKDDLEAIADEIGLKAREKEDPRPKYRQALAMAGIKDRMSLIAFGVNRFRDKTFGELGQGKTFLRGILGRRIHAINLRVLNELAKVLEFPQLCEESIQKCRKALRDNRITDRNTLVIVGPVVFMNMDFGDFKKGPAFVNAVLGRNTRNLSTAKLLEVAEALNLPVLSDESIQFCVKELAKYGVTSRAKLNKTTLSTFETFVFGDLGKWQPFCRLVLGRVVRILGRDILLEVADELKLKKN